MNEFSRCEILIGKEKLELIKTKTVLVIGLGGVGGYAIESLVRNGIENIILCDYDRIDITNINRQVIALHSTIGEDKTKVKIINEFIDKDNINNIFMENIDYVIDACDTIETKKEIIKICLDKNIKFISCMGTAKKLDPTRLKITDLRNTNYDKIAKILRKWVKDEKIKGKINVVSSSEEVIKTSDNKKLGSMSFVPNTAGILCAKYVIDDIIFK